MNQILIKNKSIIMTIKGFNKFDKSLLELLSSKISDKWNNSLKNGVQLYGLRELKQITNLINEIKRRYKGNKYIDNLDFDYLLYQYLFTNYCLKYCKNKSIEKCIAMLLNKFKSYFEIVLIRYKIPIRWSMKGEITENDIIKELSKDDHITKIYLVVDYLTQLGFKFSGKKIMEKYDLKTDFNKMRNKIEKLKQNEQK